MGAERAAEKLPEFVRRIKDGNVTHKMIYGSDGPQFPGYLGRHLEAYVAEMKDANYTVEEMRNVLADNFSRVFSLPKFQP